MKIFTRLYHRIFVKEKTFFKKIREVIGYTPVHLHLYKTAFLHKSSINDQDSNLQHNERLEFLGDSVLNSVVAEYLFKKYPLADEGFLTKMRSKIVKRSTLNSIADQMRLDEIFSSINAASISQSMLGNALEALIGAIYLENGYNHSKKFIIKILLKKHLNIHKLEVLDDNFKSILLEMCQKQGKEVSFHLVLKYKFDKRDRFRVSVAVDGEELAQADDFNKKNAEQIASEKALKRLGVNTNKSQISHIES